MSKLQGKVLRILPEMCASTSDRSLARAETSLRAGPTQSEYR